MPQQRRLTNPVLSSTETLKAVSYRCYKSCPLQVLQRLYPTGATKAVPYRCYKGCPPQVLQRLSPTGATKAVPYRCYKSYPLQVLQRLFPTGATKAVPHRCYKGRPSQVLHECACGVEPLQQTLSTSPQTAQRRCARSSGPPRCSPHC